MSEGGYHAEERDIPMPFLPSGPCLHPQCPWSALTSRHLPDVAMEAAPTARRVPSPPALCHTPRTWGQSSSHPRAHQISVLFSRLGEVTPATCSVRSQHHYEKEQDRTPQRSRVRPGGPGCGQCSRGRPGSRTSHAPTLCALNKSEPRHVGACEHPGLRWLCALNKRWARVWGRERKGKESNTESGG